MNWAERTQLVLAIATMPVSATFIWRFSHDLWWRSWFGRSLMMIAVAVLIYTLATVLFRLYGSDYPGRSALVVSSSALTFVAMVTRTVVLVKAQNADRRRSRGSSEHRH